MKKVVEKFICDFCNQETKSEDIMKQFQVTYSTSKDTRNYISLNIYPVIEYGPSPADICRKCLIKLLLAFCKENETKNEKD